MVLLVVFAFLAGVVTILSPCILPILPIILSSSFGGKQVNKWRPLGVVAGFVASFTFFTLFLSTIVRLSGISADALRLFAVLVVGGFGISLLIPKLQFFIEQAFSRLTKFAPHSNSNTGFGSGFIVGLSLGLLWTPCVGPILASVLSLAISGTVTTQAFFIALAYSAGTSLPMLLIMLGGQSMLKRAPWLLENTGKVQKAFGGVMVLTAIGILFNLDRQFQTLVLDRFPQYGAWLTQIEDTQPVRQQVENFINGIR